MPHKKRIEALQTLLARQNCQAFLVEDHTNLFYLTGLELSAGKLIVHAQGADLFVDNRYFELCQIRSPVPVHLVEACTAEECLARDALRWIRALGFDSTRTTYKEFHELHSQGLRLDIDLVPLDDPIGQLRIIKDPSEIAALSEAARLGSAGYDYILTLLREGITELEIAQELEIFWKRRGSKGLAFDPIIAFGANSSMPHYRPGHVALKRGDIVLIDIGVNCHHYHSDMTRTVFFGSADKRLVEIYAIVKEAQEAALAICRPGVSMGELDKAARQHIISKGFGDFFIHSLGHGVGLDIHEAPWLRNRMPHSQQLLAAGMVVTIEPGIYLAGIGGVRIEDSIAITERGYENLTLRSKEITIL